MRKGCLLAAFAFVVVAGFVLYTTRSLQIDRGLRLDSYVAGDFTLDVRSYGNWIESRQLGDHVSTHAQPYTLVLAIQPRDRNVKSIEVLAAFAVDKLGNKASVLDKIKQTVEDVKSRSAAFTKSPYAAFVFDALLDSNDSITLEIEFRTNLSNNSETKRQSLEIKGFEKKSRSFVFWDIMSGV